MTEYLYYQDRRYYNINNIGIVHPVLAKPFFKALEPYTKSYIVAPVVPSLIVYTGYAQKRKFYIPLSDLKRVLRNGGFGTLKELSEKCNCPLVNDEDEKVLP